MVKTSNNINVQKTYYGFTTLCEWNDPLLDMVHFNPAIVKRDKAPIFVTCDTYQRKATAHYRHASDSPDGIKFLAAGKVERTEMPRYFEKLTCVPGTEDLYYVIRYFVVEPAEMIHILTDLQRIPIPGSDIPLVSFY